MLKIVKWSPRKSFLEWAGGVWGMWEPQQRTLGSHRGAICLGDYILVPGKHKQMYHILPDHIFFIQFHNMYLLFMFCFSLNSNLYPYWNIILYHYPQCSSIFQSLDTHLSNLPFTMLWIKHILMTQIGWRTCVEHLLNSIARCSTAGALARQNPSNKNTAGAHATHAGYQTLKGRFIIYIHMYTYSTSIDLINEYHAGTWMAR